MCVRLCMPVCMLVLVAGGACSYALIKSKGDCNTCFENYTSEKKGCIDTFRGRS